MAVTNSAMNIRKESQLSQTGGDASPTKVSFRGKALSKRHLAIRENDSSCSDLSGESDLSKEQVPEFHYDS